MQRRASLRTLSIFMKASWIDDKDTQGISISHSDSQPWKNPSKSYIDILYIYVALCIVVNSRCEEADEAFICRHPCQLGQVLENT